MFQYELEGEKLREREREREKETLRANTLRTIFFEPSFKLLSTCVD